jgi:uncharacterized protein (UPF0548 family)
MISITKPSAEAIRRDLERGVPLDFTYRAVGATAGTPPAGYAVDHTRVRLGTGAEVFRVACQAIRQWRQFQLNWLEATPANTPIEPGAVVAVVAHLLGIWSVNFARIVYTVDEQIGPVRRFGFAYGTLPHHVESGEERFLIEWDIQTDNVDYDILAFSRPRHLVARLGYPFVRRMQHRFGRESATAMQQFIRTQAYVADDRRDAQRPT